jgi:DNA-binding transcriptional regulator YdaS (Cro superfamily)
MDLKSFLAPLSPDQRDDFAKRSGAKPGHLRNVMYGFRPCATDLAVSIERESKGAVRRWELRPDDWHKHWPELVGADGAPLVAKLKVAA